MIVYITDHYIGDGTSPENAFRPALLDAGILRNGEKMNIQPSDHATNQIIPDPNALVAKLEVIDIDAILAHPDYGVGAVLYDEPNPYPPNGPPSAAEYGQRRAYFARLGVSNAQFRAMFGEPGNPHTRKVGADNCIQWTKGLKRGG